MIMNFLPRDAEQITTAVPLTARELHGNPIEDAKGYVAARVEPTTYPGRRPEGGFTGVETDGDSVALLPTKCFETIDENGRPALHFNVQTDYGVCDLDDILRSEGAAEMADRVPIITFGSNANPAQLANKFKDLSTAADHHIIPTTETHLEGATPVYVPKVGTFGYSFADLYPEAGAKTAVMINWLSPDQLVRMAETEASYTLCRLGDVRLDETDVAVPAQLYVGKVSVYSDEKGNPVRLREVPTVGSGFTEMSQEEIQTELLRLTGDYLREAFPHIGPEELLSAEGLRTVIKNMPGKNRKGDPLARRELGGAMARYLEGTGRVQSASLLDTIPREDQDITPLTLRQIMQ